MRLPLKPPPIAPVVTDPQHNFLSPKGVFCDGVKASVTEKQILLLGPTGNVGNSLTPRLTAMGADVRALAYVEKTDLHQHPPRSSSS